MTVHARVPHSAKRAFSVALALTLLELLGRAAGGASLVGAALGTAPSSLSSVLGAAYVGIHLATVVLVPPLFAAAIFATWIARRPS